MKETRHIGFIIILLAKSLFVFSQIADSSLIWKGSTAFTIPRGELEGGLWQPVRTGLSPKIELSAHPLLFFIYPNAGLKIRLFQAEKYLVSSEHRLSCPTYLLKIFQMKGAGGLVSPQYSISFMLSMYNGILISTLVNAKAILTAEAGVYLSAGNSSLDKNSSIDLPVIYPRLASLYHQPEFAFSIEYNSFLFNHFNYLLAAKAFISPGVKENQFYEQSGMLLWKPGKHFIYQAGYKLCFGRYAFGSQWNLLPNIEIGYHFGRK